MSSLNSIFIPIESLVKQSPRNESFDFQDLFEQNQPKKPNHELSPQSVADINRLTPGSSVVISSVFPRSASEALFDNSTKFRQLPCRTFISVGTCPYRERCVYLHDPRCICREAKTKTRRKNKEDIVVDALFWPVMPFSMVAAKLDANRQPHVIQPYSVPIPQMDNYRSHDQAVYSMWMHFVDFCQANSESMNGKRGDEAVCFKAPDTPLNAYTDKERLKVFRALSATTARKAEGANGQLVGPAAAGDAVIPQGPTEPQPFIPIDIRNLHYPPVNLKKTASSYSGAVNKRDTVEVTRKHSTAIAAPAAVQGQQPSYSSPPTVKGQRPEQLTYCSPKTNGGGCSISPNTVAGSPLQIQASQQQHYSLPHFDFKEVLPYEVEFPLWNGGVNESYCFHDPSGDRVEPEQHQQHLQQEREDFTVYSRSGYSTSTTSRWTAGVHGEVENGNQWTQETEEWMVHEAPAAAATPGMQYQEKRFNSTRIAPASGRGYVSSGRGNTWKPMERGGHNNTIQHHTGSGVKPWNNGRSYY